MTTLIDRELRDAFDAASDFVQPQPGLADRARAGVRRRRRRMVTVAAATCAVALGAGATAYAALGHHRDAATAQKPGRSSQVLATVSYQVTMMAVSGAYLYVLAGQNNMLSAYDRATGKLIRQVTTPAAESAMAIGPGGLIWLAFYPDQTGGPTGIWLLSPDLRVRASAAGIQTSTILPTGQTSALIPTQNGLLSLRMPAPGHPGKPVHQLEPGTSLGPSQNTAAGSWSGRVSEQVAVAVTNGAGEDGHLVIAGEPSLRFGGSAQTQLGAITSTGTALWATTFARRDGEATPQGPLVRLDSRLTPTTPSSLQDTAVLDRSESVWSDGDTIWVATGVSGHNLVCFTAGNQIGPVTTMPVSGEIAALAATPSTVYVNAVQPPGSSAPSHLTAYPVPAACR